MRYVKIFCLIVCISCIALGCKKDTAGNHCEELKNALVAGAQDDIKSLVNTYISQLPSQAYTEQNINELTSSLSKECSISTLVFCFDCVATLPSMSEFQITVTSTQPTISKVVDISYTPANNMNCVHVHD
jgi:protoheme ferro-lyase